MENLKQSLVEKLQENRPNLSQSSLRTYVSTLANLPKRCKLEGGENINLKWYDDNAHKIMQDLNELTPNKRKSVLSALFILTKNENVQTEMRKDLQEVNDFYKEQKMSEVQKENWIDWSDVLKIYDDLRVKTEPLFKAKALTPKQFEALQSFVLLSCYVLVPPRRCLDYAVMRLKDYNKSSQNYFDGKQFVFNVYKTAKNYGEKTILLPKELCDILKKWKKINTGEMLLYSSNGKKHKVRGRYRQ